MPLDDGHRHDGDDPGNSQIHFRLADPLSRSGYFEHSIDICCLKHVMDMMCDITLGQPIVLKRQLMGKQITQAFYVSEGDSINITGPVGRQYQERMKLLTSATLNKIQ
jgi:hypothetical protein